jgi:hypothetical protein
MSVLIHTTGIEVHALVNRVRDLFKDFAMLADSYYLP